MTTRKPFSNADLRMIRGLRGQFAMFASDARIEQTLRDRHSVSAGRLNLIYIKMLEVNISATVPGLFKQA